MLRLLDREPDDDDGAGVDLSERDELDEKPRRVIRCAACGHELTRHEERFRKDGRDDHVFTNPHGFVFRIACFRHAEGVGAVGDESDEWAWFPGWNWQTTVCRGCLTHVGWLFRQGNSSFYGLVLAKLDL